MFCIRNGKSFIEYIKYLSEKELDRIECYPESFSDEDIKIFNNIAQNLDLIMTSGSDFHGEKDYLVKLGIGLENLHIPKNLLIKMKEHKMLNNILEILEGELEMSMEDVSEDKTLSSTGIDSITFMTMIIYLEEKFEIEFSFDGIFMQEYSNITFKDLIVEIQKLIDEKA